MKLLELFAFFAYKLSPHVFHTSCENYRSLTTDLVLFLTVSNKEIRGCIVHLDLLAHIIVAFEHLESHTLKTDVKIIIVLNISKLLLSPFHLICK